MLCGSVGWHSRLQLVKSFFAKREGEISFNLSSVAPREFTKKKLFSNYDTYVTPRRSQSPHAINKGMMAVGQHSILTNQSIAVGRNSELFRFT